MFLSGGTVATLLLVALKWGWKDLYEAYLKPHFFRWDVCLLCLGFWLNTALLTVFILFSGVSGWYVLCAFPGAAISFKITQL